MLQVQLTYLQVEILQKLVEEDCYHDEQYMHRLSLALKHAQPVPPCPAFPEQGGASFYDDDLPPSFREVSNA